MDSPSSTWISMFSRGWIVCGILGSNKEGSRWVEEFRQVSRTASLWLGSVKSARVLITSSFHVS